MCIKIQISKGEKMFGFVNLYLLWGAWKDLKVKKISDQYLWMGAIAGIIYSMVKVITGEFVWKERFIAVLPGILILIIGKITNEKIGYGDGWLILILGSFLKFSEIYLIVQLAVILAAVVSAGLLCTKRVGKEYRLAFLPFLWAAYFWYWRTKYG